MLQGEHSAILQTFIKLPFSIKTFILSIFKWPLKTGFTVLHIYNTANSKGPGKIPDPQHVKNLQFTNTCNLVRILILILMLKIDKQKIELKIVNIQRIFKFLE